MDLGILHQGHEDPGLSSSCILDDVPGTYTLCLIKALEEQKHKSPSL